jgi:hypothetical protein
MDASVGRVNGVKNSCHNVPKDRDEVRTLLNAIPASSGGAGGSLGPETGSWGTVSDQLYQAILTFQRFHAASANLFVDGHVDPHEKTLALLNTLASSSATPSFTPLSPLTIVTSPPKTLAKGKLDTLRPADFRIIPVTLPGSFDINFTLTSSLPGTDVKIKIDISGLLSRSATILLTAPVLKTTWSFAGSGPGAGSVRVDLHADATVSVPGLSSTQVPASLFSVDFEITG